MEGEARADVMQSVNDIAGCRRAIVEARRDGRTIGFAPTMGGLHAGHASLIERCRADGHFTVVSVFVNPMQFGPGEDYRRYPRDAQADERVIRGAGGDLVFSPGVEEMYSAGDETRVRPGRLAEGMCGAHRPGHFEGVCTVVAKLLHIVGPDRAYFGLKDYQQALVIRAMVADLKMGVGIELCPIVREADGLAMSTRNGYLSAAERVQAASLYRALCRGRELIDGGEASSGRLVAAMRTVIDAGGPSRIDYISIVNPETLVEVDEARGRVLLAAAVRIGTARLIDNLLVETRG